MAEKFFLPQTSDGPTHRLCVYSNVVYLRASSSSRAVMIYLCVLHFSWLL